MRISTSQQFEQSVRAMLDQQAQLAHTQAQLSSGQRIQAPSDDPAGARRILALQDQLAELEQYGRNGDAATARLGIEENALTGVIGVLQRARELAVAAGSPALGQDSLAAQAGELRQLGEQLLGMANIRDANGEYLFSGYRGTTQPFLRGADGSVTYAGDQGQRLAQIGASRTVATGDAGDAVFTGIRAGNGHFTALADPANTGTGVILPGAVVDMNQWLAGRDQYRIAFVTNAAGELAYQITGSNSGQLVPAPPAVAPDAAPAWQAGADLQFQGVQVRIEGQPAVGDQFEVAPSGARDVFAMIDDLAAALAAPADTPAQRTAQRNEINRALSDFDRALAHLGEVRSAVGGRLIAIDRQRELNDDLLLHSQSLLAEVADLDYAAAISRLSQQQLALDAAQQAYLRVQGLSLFDHLG